MAKDGFKGKRSPIPGKGYGLQRGRIKNEGSSGAWGKVARWTKAALACNLENLRAGLGGDRREDLDESPQTEDFDKGSHTETWCHLLYLTDFTVLT